MVRHAAASYRRLDVLDYLVSRGGDVNITDNDNDTPIYTVETIEVAQWLIERGAVINRQNNEGLSVQSPINLLINTIWLTRTTILFHLSACRAFRGGPSRDLIIPPFHSFYPRDNDRR